MVSARKWQCEEESTLIQFYKEYPVLWNAKHKNYFRHDVRDALHMELVDQMRATYGIEISCMELKSKFKNMRGAFFREIKKISLSKKSGSGTLYVPRWVHFHELKFLSNSAKANESVDSLQLSNGNQFKSDTGSSQMEDTKEVMPLPHVQIGSPETIDLVLSPSVMPESPESPPIAQQSQSQEVIVFKTPIQSTSKMESNTSLKRRISKDGKGIEHTRLKFYKQATDYLSSPDKDKKKELTCNELFGQYVGRTLDKFSEDDLCEECKAEIMSNLAKYLKACKKV